MMTFRVIWTHSHLGLLFKTCAVTDPRCG